MVPNAGLLIELARQRVLDLQGAAGRSRVEGRRVGSSPYRLHGSTWIRPRRESS